jgi:hypothetical protein
MLTVQCTQKLSEKLNVPIENIDFNEINPLYSWHANLFVFNRKNGVILMNNQTYYNIVLFGLKKEQFNQFGRIAIDAIRDNFAAEGFASQVIERYLTNAETLLYTKTHDRSILGQMNDLIFMTQCFLEDCRSDEQIDIIALNKQNNRTPMIKRKHSRAINALKESLLQEK